MSGVFRPEQNHAIEATDDPDLAQRHGLTEWDDEREQFVAPSGDAGQVDDAEPYEWTSEPETSNAGSAEQTGGGTADDGAASDGLTVDKQPGEVEPEQPAAEEVAAPETTTKTGRRGNRSGS